MNYERVEFIPTIDVGRGVCSLCRDTLWLQPGVESRHTLVDCIEELVRRVENLEAVVETDQQQ